MIYTHIDFLTVIIASVLNMVIGFFWYSKWLFGDVWLKFSGLNPKEIKGANITFLFAFISSLITAFFIEVLETSLSITSVTDGMLLGLLLWLGFVATTQINSVLFGKRPFQLFLVDTGYKLLSFLVMSGLLGA